MLKRLLPFLPIFLLIACFPPTDGGMDPVYLTAAIQTLTATMWTPAPVIPSATPEPITGKIIEILNKSIIGVDPLADTIEAKYNVVDTRIIYDPPFNTAGTLSIHIECEWIYTNNCTLERSFVILMHAFAADEKNFETISEQVPATVHTLQMVSYDHMKQIGMIIVPWSTVSDYAKGKINGSQLGLRITRLATTP